MWAFTLQGEETGLGCQSTGMVVQWVGWGAGGAAESQGPGLAMSEGILKV